MCLLFLFDLIPVCVFVSGLCWCVCGLLCDCVRCIVVLPVLGVGVLVVGLVWVLECLCCCFRCTCVFVVYVVCVFVFV